MTGRDRSHSPRQDRQRRKFQVILKNLPFSVKWKTLKDRIKEVVGDVKYANVVELLDGRSAGFGYAEFSSQSDMETCVRQMHRKPFEGRDIKVFRDCDESELRECMQLAGLSMDALPHKPVHGRDSGFQGPGRRSHGSGGGGTPATVNGVPVTSIPGFNVDDDTLLRLGEGTIGPSVFVHNILFEVSIPQIKDVFSLAGSVIDVEIPKSGLAVITFSSPIEAMKAVLLLNNQELMGRKLMVKIDGDKRKVVDNDSGGDKYGYNSYRQNNYQHPPPHQEEPRYPEQAPPPFEFKKVLIQELPYSVTTQQIRDLFERIGEVDRVQLSDDKCEVEFYRPSDAQLAVQKISGAQVNGRSIKVVPTR